MSTATTSHTSTPTFQPAPRAQYVPVGKRGWDLTKRHVHLTFQEVCILAMATFPNRLPCC